MEIILPIILVVLFVLLFNTIVKNYTKASKNQNDIPLDRTDTNIDFADTYEAYQETEYEADVYEINEVNCEKEFCNKAHCEDKAMYPNMDIMDGIENAGSAKGVVAKNIVKIRKWFADYDISQSVSADTKTDQVIPEATTITEEKAKTVSVADNSQEEKVQTPRVVVAQPEENVPADMIAYLTELLGKAAKVTTVVKSVTVVDTISATVTFSLLRQFR